jgi:hypothetical protein
MNLSFLKYHYNSIYETAIDQLDHIFLVIGNGYDYDPLRGPLYEGIGLLESDEHDFELARTYHVQRYHEISLQYNKYLAEYEDLEVPESILKMVREAKASYEVPEFKLMERDYYFNPAMVAAESITKTMSEKNKRWGTGEHWRTPYTICEYSIITQVRKTDDPVLVELALCTAKAWIIILDYYIENGLFLTQEQVDERKPGTVYYQSIMYMNKSHADLSAIINELENNND